MLVSPSLTALLKVLLSILTVPAATPTPAPGPVPGFAPVLIPSSRTRPGARSVPSFPVPATATASAPLLFLCPGKQTSHTCSEISQQNSERTMATAGPTPQNLPVVAAPLLALLVCTWHQSFQLLKCISCHFHIIFIQHVLQERHSVRKLIKHLPQRINPLRRNAG